MIAEYGGTLASTAVAIAEYFTVNLNSINSMQVFAAVVIVGLLFVTFKR